jgi:hypothetical protein
MKRYVVLAAVLVLLLCIGWVVARTARPAPRHSHRHARSHTPTLLAAWQYQCRQAHHWRDLMLQR